MSAFLSLIALSKRGSAAPAMGAVWTTAGASATLLLILFFADLPGMLRIAICSSAVAIGILLYRRMPLYYIQFTLWLWFVTPLVRRVIDLRFGFADQNLVLLAPLLVTAVAGISLKNLPFARLQMAPFLLCIFAVLYGFIIGLILNPSGEVIYGFFNWVCPPLFGLFVYLRWPLYPEMKRVIQQTFVWGTGIMAAYAIYQYCSPPRWDVYWWMSLPYGMVAAFGRPYPYEIRVWSTLNAPAPFASVLGMSLLLTFSSRSKMTLPCGLLGYLAFALTLSRTEWLGWIVGALYLASRVKPVVVARSLGIIALIVILSAPLLTVGSADRMVKERIESFRHLAQDDSVHTRFAMYQRLAGDLVQSPFGHGVSNADVYQGYSLDSGPLRLLYNFGILGASFYLLGIATAMLMLHKAKATSGMFPVACSAVLISAIARLLSLSAFMNVGGVVVWLCVGMGLAAQRFTAASAERGTA